MFLENLTIESLSGIELRQSKKKAASQGKGISDQQMKQEILQE